MNDRDDWDVNDASILDEIQPTDKPTDIMGYVGIIMIVASPYIPAYFPAFGQYMMLSIIIGFIILIAPNILKYKEIAGKVFIGSETYIGEDDVYEQFAVDDIIEVIAAAEPFPFAEHCYKEEDITEYLHSVGGKSQITPDLIKEQINLEVKRKAKELELNPSIIRTLKAKWHFFRNKNKDETEYKLKDGSEFEIVEASEDE